MEKMINLRDLLMHEVQDLYSAEEQIIEALPSMIDKASNKELKKALQDHLKVTEKQKERLDQVKQLLGGEEEGGEENKGVFSRLFGSGGGHKCRGTEGLIEEGEKVMAENMTSEVRDAAIIASAQKIEHYEICGYGTARAYARELNLGEVAELLEETLNEEYQADDLLTDLAVGRLNEEAEKGKSSNGRGRDGKSSGNRSNGRATSSRSGGSAGNGRSSSGKSSSKSASKSSRGGSASKGSKASKSGSSRGGAFKGGSRGGASKGGASKSRSAGRGASKASAGSGGSKKNAGRAKAGRGSSR